MQIALHFVVFLIDERAIRTRKFFLSKFAVFFKFVMAKKRDAASGLTRAKSR